MTSFTVWLLLKLQMILRLITWKFFESRIQGTGYRFLKCLALTLHRLCGLTSVIIQVLRYHKSASSFNNCYRTGCFLQNIRRDPPIFLSFLTVIFLNKPSLMLMLLGLHAFWRQDTVLQSTVPIPVQFTVLRILLHHSTAQQRLADNSLKQITTYNYPFILYSTTDIISNSSR